MSIQVFPAEVTTVANFANTVSATTANILYEATHTFESGTYTLTSPSIVVATVEFFNGTTSLASAATTSGTAALTIAQNATKITFFTIQLCYQNTNCR